MDRSCRQHTPPLGRRGKVDIERGLSYLLRFTVSGAPQPHTSVDGCVFHTEPTGATWVELKVIVTYSYHRTWPAGDRDAKSLLLTCFNSTKKTAVWKGTDCSPVLVPYSTDATHMHRLYIAKDRWEYSSREWVQIAVEPRGIWQDAPCLPANWVLMNHWFGMLHVPCDGWCHWCIEDAQSSGREAGSDGRSDWTWEAGWHCRLHTEHSTHSPDVTGQDTRITSHPAPHNGNNCVMGWQFTAPFDSSNTFYNSGVTASLSTQQGQCDKGHNCDKSMVLECFCFHRMHTHINNWLNYI